MSFPLSWFLWCTYSFVPPSFEPGHNRGEEGSVCVGGGELDGIGLTFLKVWVSNPALINETSTTCSQLGRSPEVWPRLGNSLYFNRLEECRQKSGSTLYKSNVSMKHGQLYRIQIHLTEMDCLDCLVCFSHVVLWIIMVGVIVSQRDIVHTSPKKHPILGFIEDLIALPKGLLSLVY